MRYPVQREIAEQPWKLWFSDLPDHPAVERGTVPRLDERGGENAEETGNLTDLERGDVGFILKVRRPELSDPPPPPNEIEGWLEPGWERPENDSVQVIPELSETKAGVQESVAFEDDPQRVQTLELWLRKRDEWTKSEHPARKAMEVFERLYALQAMLERESERFELMLGDGLLLWSRTDHPVHHPVLLLRVQLVFDPSIPEFRLVETEYPPELYVALFRAMSDVSADAVNRLRDDLNRNLWHPLGGESTSLFLKRVVMELSPHGEFIGDGAPNGHAKGPEIGRYPVVFLRFRTLGLGTALDSILEDLPGRTIFPEGLSGIVGVEPAGWKQPSGDEPTGQVDPNGEDEHILLSKEANAGQLEIARRLERFGAVLVQGPPGTGKTHTIANILGHLLSHGKSVLVTAHTAKALRVLRDYIVEPLKPLCVSVLDGTNEQLEDSVEEISSRLSGSSDDLLEREAEKLERQRKDTLRQLREARTDLLQARQGEYRCIVVAGAEYDPSQAGRVIAGGVTNDSWIPSPVTPGASLPLSVGELTNLYHTNKVLTSQDQEELSIGLPDPEGLAAPSVFESMCDHQSRLQVEQLNFRADLWEESGELVTSDGLADLLRRVTDVSRLLEEVKPWELATIVAGREGGPRRQAWEELLAEIEAVDSLSAKSYPLLVRYAPSIQEDRIEHLSLSSLEEMGQHVRKGGSIGTLQLFMHHDWKVVLETTRVDGKPPHLPEHFDALKTYVELREARSRLRERWSRQISSLEGPTSDSLGPEPEKACRQYVPLIRQSLAWFTDIWLPLEDELRHQGFHWDVLLSEVPADFTPFGELLKLRTVVVEYLPQIISVHAARVELRDVQRRFKELSAALEATAAGPAEAPTVRQLREAVATLSPVAYHDVFERLVDLRARQKFVDLRRDLLARLEQVAPGWAAATRNREGIHGGYELPGNPQQAWVWRQLNDEIDRRAAVSLEEIQARTRRLRRQLLGLTAQLIERRTWASQVRRTSLAQRQALNGWKALLKKVGRRTGKNAPSLLAEARRLMPICQSAVPVWIMPLSQVFESFDPKRNSFDVVIVDEASQADVTALAALYMGKQVIIVGDDEQVTPDAVGLRFDDVQQIIDAFLKGIPNRKLYDGQTSIYDLAKISFGGTVMLREHFRCVPDIIQFSNRLSYHGRIQPLRDPSSVRLRPYTVAYRVNGTIGDRNTNETEARAVASLLIAATEQPEYSEASFGVISLVGAEQAARIDLLLQRFLSPREYHRRRVQCGNPAQFQGDERDVVFLSMVYSPTGNGPLPLVPDPGQRIKKRFNVAASRARDQLWVVHSLDPDNDLQPNDIRRELILHARDPKAVEVTLAQLEPETESEFEKQVLQRLLAKGYKVAPQWRVGPYRIDLVVEDGTGQLAVECDGDRFHTPERLEADMLRQTVLERMGWRFIRIRGTEFFRDPDNAMESLLRRLEELSIRPINQHPVADESAAETDSLLSRVVRRAEEFRREWDEHGDQPVPGSHRRHSPARVRNDHRDEASVGSKRDDKGDVSPKQTHVVPAFDQTQPTLFNLQPQKSSPAFDDRRDTGSGGCGPQQTLYCASETVDIRPASASHPKPQHRIERTRIAPDANQFEVAEFLRSQGLEVIDKRPAGGALWVVGGQELGESLRSLTDRGHRFSFAANGGQATKNRPAWYTK